MAIDALHVVAPLRSFDDCRAAWASPGVILLLVLLHIPLLLLRGLDLSGFFAVDGVVTDGLAAGAYRS